MKCLLFLITLAVCLAGCDHHQPSLSSLSDAEIQKKLVGTWREGGHEKYSIVVVDSNGNFEAQSDPSRNITDGGTWIIKDRKLIWTYTKSNQTMAPAYLPNSNRCIIVRLDDRELVMKLEDDPEHMAIYQKQMK